MDVVVVPLGLWEYRGFREVKMASSSHVPPEHTRIAGPGGVRSTERSALRGFWTEVLKLVRMHRPTGRVIPVCRSVSVGAFGGHRPAMIRCRDFWQPNPRV